MREKSKPKMARFIAFDIKWMGSFICLFFVYSFIQLFIQQIFSECQVYAGIFLNTEESNIYIYIKLKF